MGRSVFSQKIHKNMNLLVTLKDWVLYRYDQASVHYNLSEWACTKRGRHAICRQKNEHKTQKQAHEGRVRYRLNYPSPKKYGAVRNLQST